MSIVNQTSSNNLINELCKDIISQIVKVFMEKDNVIEVKKKIIEPLLSGISTKFIYCYLILIFMLILLIVVNCVILYLVFLKR